MVMKRVPSFSSRPGFPSGLKVFLIESDAKHREYVQKQLQQCSYEVHTCGTLQEMMPLSQSEQCDVVLAEFKALSNAACDANVVEFLRTTPLVLMSECPSTEDIMSGVKLGAVEVLEKPVSQTKLRTLWQHTVRKMMSCLSFTAVSDSCNEPPSLLVIPEFDEPLSPARSGASNSSNGGHITEGDTELSSQSHAADNIDTSEMSGLTRAASMNSSRCSSPDLRKRKSMDGLDHPKCKSSRDSVQASPAPIAAAVAVQVAAPPTTACAPIAAPGIVCNSASPPAMFNVGMPVSAAVAPGVCPPTQAEAHKPGMVCPAPVAMPQPPAGLLNMLAPGFRPPTGPLTPLPPGMVWGLPMPPPGLMFPPGFIPPPFPAGFPIPPPMMNPCFPPVCGRPPMHMPANPGLPMAPVPNHMTNMPHLQAQAAPVPVLPPMLTPSMSMPLPSPPPPVQLTPTPSPSSTSQDTLLAHSPHSHSLSPSSPALHPSPSLVSLDVAESADPDDKQGVALGMGIDDCPLPVEVTADSLGDLPHFDVSGDTTALLFSDWLLDDGEPDMLSDASLLGLHLKKSNSFVDLINDSLCTTITAAG